MNIQEEKRIQEIDEIACLFDPETVRAAKYGPNACTASEMAYRAALDAARRGITAREAEAKAAVRALFHSPKAETAAAQGTRAVVKELLHGQE